MTQDKEVKAKKKADKKAAKAPKKTLTDVFNLIQQQGFQIQQLQRQANNASAMIEYLMNCNMVVVDYTINMRAQIKAEQEVEKAARQGAVEAYREQQKDNTITTKKTYDQLYQEIKHDLVQAQQKAVAAQQEMKQKAQVPKGKPIIHGEKEPSQDKQSD